MNILKSSKGCLLPIGIVLIGLVGFFVWSTFLSARFSALGACDQSAGCLFTAVNGNRQVSVIGFSADNGRFLTDGTHDAIIHDASNGNKIGTLDEGTDNHQYVIAGDHSEIIAHRTNSVKFFDWEGEILRTWTPDENDGVRDVAMVPMVDGFVTASRSGVSLWKMADGSLITPLAEMEGIMHVTASANGDVVAAYNFVENQLLIWPLANLEEQIIIDEVEALSIHLSSDGSLVAAGGPNGAFVWNSADGTLVNALEPEGQKATATGFSEDGKLLAVGFENGVVLVLDIVADELIASFPHEYSADNISFMSNNEGLAVGLNFDVTTSGGELIFHPRRDGVQREPFPGEMLRTSENRQSFSPGYAVVWELP